MDKKFKINLKLFSHPFFLFGLFIRIVLISIVSPYAISEWYAPFLETAISSPSLDPWSEWIESGGALAAFPYGISMLLTFLPLQYIFDFFSLDSQISYFTTILIMDLVLLFFLDNLVYGRKKLILVTYWLSPIIILASYVYGLNDLIPISFLIISIFYLRKVNLVKSGVFLSLAISSKLSMIISLPFFLIYLYNNKSLRIKVIGFFKGLIITSVILGTPFILSSDGINMLFGNPEVSKIFTLSLPTSEFFVLYIVPMLYLIMLYFVWRVKRLNFNLFRVMIGMVFLFLVLMIPASPGWFVWSIPFLVQSQAHNDKKLLIIIFVFSVLYVLSTLLVNPVNLLDHKAYDLFSILSFSESQMMNLSSIIHTFVFASGLILGIKIWREEVNKNDYFRLSRKPLVIGISGDSGSGKDTLADSLVKLFGSQSSVKLSGDDYHLWDRNRPMWKVTTHLNPLANNLELFSNDLIRLIDGKSIQINHYNHSTGKKSKPEKLKSNDFIIASGLHTLYIPNIREHLNIKIFLDMDQELRTYYKIRRDTIKRNHTVEKVIKSIERRQPDSSKFIATQKKYADISYKLVPADAKRLNYKSNNDIKLRLVVTAKSGTLELQLSRVLIGICGLNVDLVYSDDGSQIQIFIDGDTSSADIKAAAQILCPNFFEFLTIEATWEDGTLGLMQLITASYANHTLTKRLI